MKEQFNDYEFFFVYGTLMSMYGNNRLLKNEELIGKATTSNNYRMFASGIPYVLEQGGEYKIKGELWKVKKETIPSLDGLEGHPNFYIRKKINVILNENEQEVNAWIYFINTKDAESFTLNRNLSELKSGNYEQYRSTSY